MHVQWYNFADTAIHRKNVVKESTVKGTPKESPTKLQNVAGLV